MSIGNIIRAILIGIFLIGPGLWAILVHHSEPCITYFISLIMIPILIGWGAECAECDACWMTGKCEQIKKEKLVKHILYFLGYDKDQLVKITSLKYTKNNYFDIYKYIKNAYNESIKN